MSMDMRRPLSVEELWTDARDKLLACPVGDRQVEVLGSTEAFADLAWRVLRLERLLASFASELREQSPVADLPWHTCDRCRPGRDA